MHLEIDFIIKIGLSCITPSASCNNGGRTQFSEISSSSCRIEWYKCFLLLIRISLSTQGYYYITVWSIPILSTLDMCDSAQIHTKSIVWIYGTQSPRHPFYVNNTFADTMHRNSSTTDVLYLNFGVFVWTIHFIWVPNILNRNGHHTRKRFQEIMHGDVSRKGSILDFIQTGTANGVPAAAVSTRTTEWAGPQTTFTVKSTPKNVFQEKVQSTVFVKFDNQKRPTTYKLNTTN